MLSQPFKAGRTIGIGIGRQDVSAALVAYSRGKYSVEWMNRQKLPAPIFIGSPPPEAREMLAEAFTSLCAGLGKNRVPVQVALPDPSGSAMVFELEQMPPSRRMQLELVRWRISRELGVEPDTITCAGQNLGRKNGTHLLLGLAIQMDWFRCIREALQDSGLLVTVLDLEVCYRFNQFQGGFIGQGKGGVLINLQPWSWSLSIWDGEGLPRFVRSRWRDIAGEAEPGEGAREIALDAERSIRAYAKSGGGQDVFRVFVSGEKTDRERFATALNDRLRENCTQIILEENNFHVSRKWKGGEIQYGSPSLAAAMRR